MILVFPSRSDLWFSAKCSARKPAFPEAKVSTKPLLPRLLSVSLGGVNVQLPKNRSMDML
jgi:hypothetical protein